MFAYSTIKRSVFSLFLCVWLFFFDLILTAVVNQVHIVNGYYLKQKMRVLLAVKCVPINFVIAENTFMNLQQGLN